MMDKLSNLFQEFLNCIYLVKNNTIQIKCFHIFCFNLLLNEIDQMINHFKVLVKHYFIKILSSPSPNMMNEDKYRSFLVKSFMFKAVQMKKNVSPDVFKKNDICFDSLWNSLVDSVFQRQKNNKFLIKEIIDLIRIIK